MTYVSLSPSGSLGRVLLVRWPLTLLGLLMSAALAAGAFVVTPPQYMSSATIVLVSPSVKGANSLLSSDTALDTTATILTQSLSSPQTATELGMDSDAGKLTVGNGGVAKGKLADSGGPMISVIAQTAAKSRSQTAVASAVSKARQTLADLQGNLKVNSKNSISIQIVTEATPPKPVWDVTLRAVGVALAFGLLTTIAVVSLIDRKLARRAAKKRLEREGLSIPFRSNGVAPVDGHHMKDPVRP